QQIRVYVVFRDHREVGSALDHRGHPVFTGDVDAAVGEDRGRAVGSRADAFAAVDLRAGLGVQAVHDSVVADAVEVFAVGNRGRHVGPVLEGENEMRLRHVAA